MVEVYYKKPKCHFYENYKAAFFNVYMELMNGIEPSTPSLPRKCSTSEPHQHGLNLNKCCGFAYTAIH